MANGTACYPVSVMPDRRTRSVQPLEATIRRAGPVRCRAVAARLRRSRLAPLLLLALAPAAPLSGQETGTVPEQKRSGILFIPVLYYTPETKTAFGVAAQYYYRERGSEMSGRPSTIVPAVIYTQKNQIMADISGQLYWKRETYRLDGELGYSKYPDKFYGIGNDTPEDAEEDLTPRYINLRVNVQRRVYSELNLGLGYEFQHSKLLEVEEGGLLDAGSVSGSDGGTVSGAGIFASWDTRDNIFYPSSGSYHQLSASVFGSALGSDFSFNRYQLELRQYLGMLSHVLALQGQVTIATGTPPLQQLALFGGGDLMRGYYEGRYRERSMIAFQAEYRVVPIWWRLGLAAFAGLGDVAHDVGDFRLSDFNYSLGGGIRYLLSREEGITVRLDFGLGEGSSGVYITLGEAF